MNNSLETSRIVTGSLFIIASIAVAFILNFAQPFLVPLVIALLIRILIDPIIDYQIDYLHVHRIVAVFVSLCLIVFLFIIIVPFIGSSVITFLQSADDYNNKLSIIPKKHLVKNIGFGKKALHTKNKQWYSDLETQELNFNNKHPKKILVNREYDNWLNNHVYGVNFHYLKEKFLKNKILKSKSVYSLIRIVFIRIIKPIFRVLKPLKI